MIKVVFFDVDGTLVSHKTKSVPKSTRDTIKKLREKGIKCVVSTGRHMIELNELPVNDIEFDGYVLLNGQLVLDEKKKMIYGNKILDSESIENLFNKKTFPIQILEEEDTYINFVNDHVIKTQAEISSPPPRVGKLTGRDFYQAVMFVNDNLNIDLEKLLPNCKITRWNNDAVDVISKNAGKVSGMKKYLEYAGISKEETMAFGDGQNDLEMIEFVKCGVVMGNGVDILKNIADYITDDIDQDGIQKAVEKFNHLF